jgi:hypothetical protein
VPLVQATDEKFEELGLMMLALSRPDMMALHASKQRMMATIARDTPPPTKALPGFTRVMPALALALPDPHEQLPQMDRGQDGEWRLNGELFTARRLPLSRQ